MLKIRKSDNPIYSKLFRDSSPQLSETKCGNTIFYAIKSNYILYEIKKHIVESNTVEN